MLQLQVGPGSMPAASTRATDEATEGSAGVAAAAAGVVVTGATAGAGAEVGVGVGDAVAADADGGNAGTVRADQVEAWTGALPTGMPTMSSAAAMAARAATTHVDRR
jgi:hypothetical protein